MNNFENSQRYADSEDMEVAVSTREKLQLEALNHICTDRESFGSVERESYSFTSLESLPNLELTDFAMVSHLDSSRNEAEAAEPPDSDEAKAHESHRSSDTRILERELVNTLGNLLEKLSGILEELGRR